MTSSRFSLPQTRSSLDGERGIQGLLNIGNTCFLNSVVQCLSNTKPLLEYILSQEYLKELNNPARCLLIRRFSDLICSIWADRKIPLSTQSLKNAIVLYAPRFNGYNQHDAQEFLRYLLEGIHEEINRTGDQSRSGSVIPTVEKQNKSETLSADETWRRYLRSDNSKIVDIFGGLLKSILKCTLCGYTSTIFEPFWDLSLSIPQNNGHSEFQKLQLSHCLDWFIKEETLDGNEKPICSKCKTKQTCIKRILIQKFPQILVIHLKRFSNHSTAHKVHTYVDFPFEGLNMSAYSADSQLMHTYNLYAVVNHFGTCQYGHYTAYCKHSYSGNWHRFNDKLVVPMDPSTADISEAYILFYEISI